MTLAPTLLEEILALGGRAPAGDAVRFAGSDPVLPTIFPMTELGAAAIAAPALEVARIWEARTGEAQEVSLDLDAAAAAIRSARYLTTDPPPEAGRRLGGLSVYRTRDDRWIYFQQLLPHHRARLGEVLGVPNAADSEAMIAAVKQWESGELEEAVVAAGATGSVVRTEEEWARHPQKAVLDTLPLLEIIRIGDSEPEPVPGGARPLSGLRVLDMTRILAGPTAARTLAEHGADVLRIGAERLPDNEAMRQDTGHGKRSTELDLATPEGLATLRGLVAGADVFSQGYRPGAFDKLGLSPEELAELRPGIVAVSLSAFGHLGPWRERRGFDSVVQSAAGLADANSVGSQAPVFLPANPLDYITGYLAAFGALVALQRRAEEGGSYLVRVSLAQTGNRLATLPRFDQALADARPKELPAERLAELMTSRETAFGRLRYLAPAVRLSRTPGYWELPTAPLANDLPEWLPR
jgi:crotonobetainyl-CoA:carnitine CoA-transferase CaiB-like acyl-CoA transferase